MSMALSNPSPVVGAPVVGTSVVGTSVVIDDQAPR